MVGDGAYALVQHFGGLDLGGKLVLELGCGTGLVGLCLKRMGAGEVVLTDQVECLGNAAKAFMRKAEAKGLKARIAAVEWVSGIVNLEEEESCCAAIIYITK